MSHPQIHPCSAEPSAAAMHLKLAMSPRNQGSGPGLEEWCDVTDRDTRVRELPTIIHDYVVVIDAVTHGKSVLEWERETKTYVRMRCCQNKFRELPPRRKKTLGAARGSPSQADSLASLHVTHGTLVLSPFVPLPSASQT